ncbi:MAG TPA: parallel beta-helix domain-containing protein [Rhodanobacteraceae bacterium]|nr:parallel beta-helix domain-containing protein [Rhodanobacteraceae bacterium]
MRQPIALTCVISAALLLAACGSTDSGSAPTTAATSAEQNFAQKLQEQLTHAKSGDVITIPAGTYHFRRGLSLRASGVTIRGAGMDKTILSFKGMISGPQGLLVNANDFTIEDLSIEDTMGDGLKIKQGKNVVIRRVRTAWTRGPDSDNGAYGIYPIRVTNLLLEDSVASGASDSGIYVGQSQNVVVRGNKVFDNVAGIEIENSRDADVYKNDASGNTGGILVFNMPNIEMVGARTRVFDNVINANNLDNFGARGTPVASIPAGSGVVINSNDFVEIFNNRISNNQTANIIVSSYYSTNYNNDVGVNPDYNPYPKAIYIHDNQFVGGGDAPDTLEFKALKLKMFGIGGRFPDVLWDGFYDPKDLGADGLPPPADRICIPNPKVGVLDADGPNKYDNPNTNAARFRCTLESLPPVKLDLATATADGNHA